MTEGTSLHLEIGGVPPVATITGINVSPEFWASLSAELGAFGPLSSVLAVEAHLLLARRRIIDRLCRRFRVSVTADDAARAMLQSADREAERVLQLLKAPEAVNETAALGRLEGGRLTRDLREFQIRDFAKLLSLPHGANFSVPGAGKTVVALALYEAERLAGRVRRLLVVAPLSAFEAWKTESEESFSPALSIAEFDPARSIRASTEVLIVNYSKLPNHFDAIAQWAAEESSAIVLDEAHRIKRGRAGAWGAACLRLSWVAERRDVLTGTPAPQHPSDLESALDFLWPGQARTILPSDAFQPVPTDQTGALVADAIRPLFVRTRKSELGLREPSFAVLELELHGLHAEIYRALTSQLYQGLFRAGRDLRLDLARMRRVVMYLLEAATNPALLPIGSDPDDAPVFQHPPLDIPPGSELADLIRDYGLYETPAKFRKLGELIKANADQGRKTLVWSYFIRNLELLSRDLGRYRPAVVHGGVKPANSSPTGAVRVREDEISRFRDDPNCLVLLANPAALGEGVSLHRACHDAIYLERTFNAGQYLQSVDRIHRLGLPPDQETRITFLVTGATIDEVVTDRVEKKAIRLGDMLDDPDIETMALPDETDLMVVDEGLGQPIDSNEDIAALFAHLRGE